MTSTLQLQQAALQVFEKVPDLYLILSPELRVITASDAYLQATNKVREEIVGKLLCEVLSGCSIGMVPGALEELDSSLQHVLRTRQSHRMDLQQFEVPDSSKPGGLDKRYCIILNAPVFDEHKRLQYIVHKLKDVTETVQGELDLIRSRELLQTTIDSSLDMIQVFEAVRDKKGEIIDFKWILNNQTAEKIYGDVLGKSLLQNNPGVVEVGIFETFKRVTETGIPDQTERHYEHEQFSGWFYQSTVKLNDGVTTTTVDITERKKNELEILQLKDEIAQKASDKYYSIFNAIDEGFGIVEILYDHSGKPTDYRFLEVNPAFSHQTGLKNVTGKTGSEVFSVNSDPYWLEQFCLVAQSGEPARFAKYSISADRWYQVYATRVEHDSNRLVALLFRDITEHKLHEARQSFLLRLSDALRPLTGAAEMQEAATRFLGDYLQVDRVFYTDSQEKKAQWLAKDGDLQRSAGIGIASLAEMDWVEQDLLQGKAVAFADIRNDSRLSGQAMEALQSQEIGAMLLVPLLKEDKWVSTITLQHAQARRWSEAEIKLARETAERTWAALVKANAEDALRASEAKYRTLFDSIDEGFCIIQILYNKAGQAYDLLYLQVNQAFERNNGLYNAEGKTIRALAPDIEPKWIDIYHQVARTGIPLRLEEESIALNRIFSLYAFRIGEPSEHKVAVIFTDITERKKSQEALRQSEEQFRLFVTASSDIIYKMSADWSRVQRLTGNNLLSETDERDANWLDGFIPEEDRALVKATIADAIRTQTIFKLEHRLIQSDGTIGWVLSRAIPVVDAQGNIKEWFGTASDITLRKQAEQQLHHLNVTLEQQVAERTHELNESKLFAEQITEATPDFIMIFSLLTNKVEFLNQDHSAANADRFRASLQIDYDQIMRHAHPEDREKLHAYIDRLRTASDQEAHTLEYRVVNPGKTVWYRARGKVFRRDAMGKPTHFISVVQDISDLKQLEQENLQMRLDQQRTNLLTILNAQEEERRRISEGLHNGVGQILYTAKLHLSHYLSQQPTKAGTADPIRQVEQIIDEAIRQTRGLSHQLAPALLEQFGLETAFREIGNLLSSPGLYIQCLVYNLPEQLEKHLQIVVYRVAQEMANNIIRHSGATEASLLLRTQGQNLVLIAEDNGRGFDPAVSLRKRIGLSSMKNRVELLNGTFSINTTPGQGTQVKITLPFY